MNREIEFLNQITVNAHSSVRIETGGKVLYVDPFKLTEAPLDADVIFFTHSHFDHFSPEDVEKLRKADTVFVLPETMASEAAQTTAGHRVVMLSPSARGLVEGIEFETVPAYNPAKPFHPRANGWVGYVLTVEGLRVYIAGDTDATEESMAVRCDIAMLPIGGKYTMDPAEAADLANLIRPRVVIPIHYGSVAGCPKDFKRFASRVDRSIVVHQVI